MKTTSKLIISLFLMAIFSITTVNAGENPQPKFGKILKKIVTYPAFAKEKNLEGTVVVCFTLDSTGAIKIKNTSETDASLKDYVINKMNNYKIAADKTNEIKNTEEQYYVKFIFKIEDALQKYSVKNFTLNENVTISTDEKQ